MGTNTSKGLYLPDTVGEVVDVAKINQNTQRLNTYGMGPVVTSSTTRPSGGNRWEGMIIHETDTLTQWVWDGSSWLPLSGQYFRASRLTGFALNNNARLGIKFSGTEGAIQQRGFAVADVTLAFAGYGGVATGPIAPVAGWYNVTATVNFGVSTAAASSTAISIFSTPPTGATGGGYERMLGVDKPGSASAGSINLSGDVLASQGDIIGCAVFQNSGGTLSVTGPGAVIFSVSWKGKAV